MFGVDAVPKALYQDFSAFGIAPPAPSAQPEFVIWPEHEAAYELFKSCDTQWHYHPISGGWVSLNYQIVFLLLKTIPKSQRADILDQIRVMERAVLEHKG